MPPKGLMKRGKKGNKKTCKLWSSRYTRRRSTAATPYYRVSIGWWNTPKDL